MNIHRPQALRALLAAALIAAGTLVAGASPASAAIPGYHAAYFSESSFLTTTIGQSGQFAVGFQNSGDQPWVRSDVSKRAALHTAAPLDNSTDFAAGWAVNWTAANIYAEQLADVAPGGVAYFIYNYVVPANATIGPHTFYGRPFVGSTPLEDYGYYQIVTVAASNAITITGTTPASPSSVTQPVVAGTGAPAGVTVTIFDGTTAVGSGNATTTGTFSVTTSPLSIGTHTLTASAPGGGVSAAVTYTVTSAVATPAPGNTLNPVATNMTQPGTDTIIVTFSKTMSAGTITAANFRWDSQTFPGTIALQAGGTAVRLAFNASALPGAFTHSLDIQNVTDTDGNRITPNPTTYRPVIASDGNRPTMGSVTAVASQTLEVTFSESMATTANGFTSNLAIDSASNYQLLNSDGSASSISVTTATTGGTDNDAAIFNLTKARLTLSSALSSNVSYTLKVSNVSDQASNSVSPNPATSAFTFSGSSSVAPTLSSVTFNGPTTNQAQWLTVTYSKAMAHASNSTTTLPSFNSCTGSGGQIDNKAIYSSTPSDLGTSINDSKTKCNISSDERTVTFQFDSTQVVPNKSYTLSVSGATDQVGNTFATNPATYSLTGGVPAPVRLSGVSSSSITVVYNTAMRSVGSTDGNYSSSATNPANYLVSPNSTYGSFCSSGTTTITADGTLTQFTLTCAGGTPTWNASSLTLRVQNVADSNGSVIVPNPSGTLSSP